MNSIFDLKSVVGLFSARSDAEKIIASENKLARSEESLFGKIADFEHDSASVQELRSQNRSNILKLQNALERVDSRDETRSEENFVIEEKSLKERREYEKSLRNQVNDIKIVIELLKKIVDAERDEVLLDIEIPFIVIDGYFSRLKKVLNNRIIKSEHYPEVQVVLEDIKKSYTTLIEITLRYVDNELNIVSQEVTINSYFNNRSQIKKQ